MRYRRAEPRITDPDTHPRRYVSLVVAAAYLEVDPKTLSKYLDEGLIAYVQFGGRRKVEVIELVEFERTHRVSRSTGNSGNSRKVSTSH